MPQTVDHIDLEKDLLVRDTDGSFKVFNHGQLEPLGDMSSQTTTAPSPTALPPAVRPQRAMTDSTFAPLMPVVTGDKVAAFAFHPDDHSDIQAELERLNYLLKDGQQKKYSVEKIAHKLADTHNLTLPPENFGRFVKILLSFFRQARSLAEAKAVLVGPADIGGLQLASNTVDDILQIARHLKDKIEAVDGVVIAASALAEEQPDMKIPAKDPFIAAPVMMTEPVRPKVMVKKLEAKPVEPVSREATVPPPTDIPVSESPLANSAESESLPRVQRPVMDKPKSRGFFGGSRGARSSKLVGKVDELAQISIREFRMLDDDPRRRAAKILQRIETLAEESVTRKAQGIEAWRSSEVYRVYMRMGQHSLESAKDIKTIVEEMAATNQETLNVEEFEAITDLNKQLRF